MVPRKRRVYDGRGDRLTDARKTEFAGRSADDLRLGHLHFRLLAHIGRQNAKRGWLRLSQSELAQQWQCSRTRLNLAVKELRQWGYIGQVDQHRSHEAVCYYQTLLDEPFPVEDNGDDDQSADNGDACEPGGKPVDGDSGGVSHARHVPEDAPSLSTDTQPDDDVSRQRDTCVSRTGDTSVSQLGDTSVSYARHPPYIELARTDFRRDSPIAPLPPNGFSEPQPASGQQVSIGAEGYDPTALRPPVVTDADRQWAVEQKPDGWDEAAKGLAWPDHVAEQAEAFEAKYANDRKPHAEWQGLWRRVWWPRADASIRHPKTAPARPHPFVKRDDPAWGRILAVLTPDERKIAERYGVAQFRPEDPRAALIAAGPEASHPEGRSASSPRRRGRKPSRTAGHSEGDGGNRKRTRERHGAPVIVDAPALGGD